LNQPVERRIVDLDVIRGVALFGVLIVNLLTEFRISLFTYLELFHTSPGRLNRAVDNVVAWGIESKAFTLFSLLFGVGMAIFVERQGARGRRLLTRRLAILLAIGLIHLLFIWNGDILAVYAVTGFLALPFLWRAPRWSLGLALVIGAVHCLPLPLPEVVPHGDEALRHGAAAARVYGTGTLSAIFHFRLYETTKYMIGPLLYALPRVFALFLLGQYAWRRGVFLAPGEHRRLLRGLAWGGITLGGAATLLDATALARDWSLGAADGLVSSLSNVPLGLGYGAALLLLLQRPRARPWLVLLAPLGRMALTNYLAQSIAFSFVFYGIGFGLFGRVGSAAAALGGIAFYALQAWASAAWLRRYRFGPVEWLWRSLTYGRLQPLTR
jgi:uncharacterized protein